MTYANAVLPHALFDASECWPNENFLPIAEASFGFLNLATSTNGIFWPIGNENWYSRGEEKSEHDQQPLEASTMVAAALAGFHRTGDEKYQEIALCARQWFTGQNSKFRSLVDAETGACCDGLQPFSLNQNQGAESTLAYLWTEVLWGCDESAPLRKSGIAVALNSPFALPWTRSGPV